MLAQWVKRDLPKISIIALCLKSPTKVCLYYMGNTMVLLFFFTIVQSVAIAVAGVVNPTYTSVYRAASIIKGHAVESVYSIWLAPSASTPRP